MMLDIHQLSEELKISESGIYQWVSQRKIPFVKIGRLVRFDSEEIQKWLKGKKVEPKAFDLSYAKE